MGAAIPRTINLALNFQEKYQETFKLHVETSTVNLVGMYFIFYINKIRVLSLHRSESVPFDISSCLIHRRSRNKPYQFVFFFMLVTQLSPGFMHACDFHRLHKTSMHIFERVKRVLRINLRLAAFSLCMFVTRQLLLL